MKKSNIKTLICLAVSVFCASYSCLPVNAETNCTIEDLQPDENGLIEATFTSKLLINQATIIKYFELLDDEVADKDVYEKIEQFGISSTDGEESTEILNTGCFKDNDGHYGASAFQLKVESYKDGKYQELKMVANQSMHIDEEHFKVTSCKTEITNDEASGKKFLKITWKINGNNLYSCTEVKLPQLWAENSADSANVE